MSFFRADAQVDPLLRGVVDLLLVVCAEGPFRLLDNGSDSYGDILMVDFEPSYYSSLDFPWIYIVYVRWDVLSVVFWSDIDIIHRFPLCDPGSLEGLEELLRSAQWRVLKWVAGR